jgi:hypothetical protein
MHQEPLSIGRRHVLLSQNSLHWATDPGRKQWSGSGRFNDPRSLASLSKRARRA